jgi:hypothetical protein
MKNLLILSIAIISCIGIKGQSLQTNQSVTYFYTVNFDKTLAQLFNSTDVNNTINESYNTFTNNDVIAGIIDTFYCIASEKFRSELSMELLPLKELQGKVKYSMMYPKCPSITNIKKVMKSASGYQYYVDYYINVYSDLTPTLYDALPPTRIRPVYAISFTIYDSNGVQVKEIKLCYKSKKTLANEQEKLDKTSQKMKSQLCSFYSEALNQLTMAYKYEYSLL